MSKLKISIISLLMILALLVMATGCDDAGDASSSSSGTDISSEMPGAGDNSGTENPAGTSSTGEPGAPSADDAQTIVGSWDSTWDISDLFNMALTLGDETVGQFVQVDKFDLLLHFTFDADGKYILSYDGDALAATMEDVAKDILEGLIDYLEYVIDENDLGVTVEELLAESGYSSVDEFADEMMGSFDGTFESFESKGEWSIQDGKLYMVGEDEEFEESEYFTYSITANELKLLEAFGSADVEEGMEDLFEAFLDGMFPMVLTRVA